MRTLLATLAVAVPALGLASFDLVLVADEGTDTIHRFDGGSGVYLGAFSGPYVNPRSMVVDQVNNVLFVGADNGIFQLDLWSGVMLAGEQVFSGPGATMLNPGEYLFSASNSLSFLGGALLGDSGWYTGANMPSTQLWKGIDYSGGVLFTASAAGMQRHSFSTFGTSATLLTTRSLLTPGNLGQMSVGDDYALIADGNSNRLHRTFSTGTGSASAYTYSSLSTLTAVDYAHNDTFYVAGRNAAGTSGLLVQSGIRFSGVSLRTYGNGILQNPTYVATIVAPEPTSMAALGLGGLLLARRRRRNR